MATLPTVLFFNVNGSGMGHLNRCLAYARQLRERASPVFFSMASAMEIIHDMGFEGDYFVSHLWSSANSFGWNNELSRRFGLLLSRVRPQVVVFDGPWPYQGFVSAIRAARHRPKLVWSRRGLLKPGVQEASVEPGLFDLIIEPGELGAQRQWQADDNGSPRLTVPPVCLLRPDEVLNRHTARLELDLDAKKPVILLSLGPGNLKDVSGIGHGLMQCFNDAGVQLVWARPPISVSDVALPDGVRPLAVYPLAKYLSAFDAFVGAAGYNSAYELVQARLPALLVPNTQLADDQQRRAQMLAEVCPVVVSPCDTPGERQAAVQQLLGMVSNKAGPAIDIPLNGAEVAAEAILSLTQAN